MHQVRGGHDEAAGAGTQEREGERQLDAKGSRADALLAAPRVEIALRRRPCHPAHASARYPVAAARGTGAAGWARRARSPGGRVRRSAPAVRRRPRPCLAGAGSGWHGAGGAEVPRAACAAGYSDDEAAVRPALHRFAVSILEQDFRRVGMARPTRGFRHLFPDPATGGACKRWHLFLRWMIRRDPPDFGDWREVSPSKLLIPLDTHIANMAHAIRLTRLRSRTGRMSADITGTLRRLDPADPVKYDFALCHTRMSGGCLDRRDARVCPACELRPVCRHW